MAPEQAGTTDESERAQMHGTCGLPSARVDQGMEVGFRTGRTRGHRAVSELEEM